MFRRTVLPWLVWFLYRLWTCSWRQRFFYPEELRRLLESGQPLIFAHWHGDELALTHLVPKYKIATMTSTSQDGELMDQVIRLLGGATSRGSSTRGGVSALKGLVRLTKSGYRASMAVDGPKGPLHEVKPGVFELSRLAGAHIVPVGVACRSAFVFNKSWNKAFLPRPFTKVAVAYGRPWSPLSKEDDVRAIQHSERLKRELSDARHQAGKLIAGHGVGC